MYQLLGMFSKFEYSSNLKSNTMQPRKILVFLIASLFFSHPAFSQSETNPVVLKKIAENIYEIQGGRGANGGLFVGDDGVMVIDSKMDRRSVDQIFTEIGKITDKPVRYLINTHSDGDHVNGNPYFPESVTIIAHENCREEFFLPARDGSPSMWLSYELLPYIPQLTFNDRMDIHLGRDRVELWYFGRGHTSGDLVVYFPEQKVAFIGDQVFMNRVPLIHLHKGGNSHMNVNYLEKMLETLDAEIFSSGHSDVTGRNDIRMYIDRMKEFQAKVAGLAEDGLTLEEVKGHFSENEASLTEIIYYEILELR
jgi:cyclase